MKDTLNLFCLNTGTSHEVPVGITLREAHDLIQPQLPFPAVSARVNYMNEGLNYRVYNAREVEFVTAADPSGMRVYNRSLCFILYKAVKELFPEGKLSIEHPIAKGVFCHITLNGQPITAQQLEQLKERMGEIIRADIPFHRHECRTQEAIRLFTDLGMTDKVRLLQSTQSLYTYYYTLGDEADYYYSVLVPSTGYIRVFDLRFYGHGLLLLGANRNNPLELEESVQQFKLLQAFQENDRFNKIIGLNTVGALNRAIAKGHASEIIKVAEVLQERKIAAIADEIVSRGDVRIILISGPSSSGKTTFCKRLQVQLWANLVSPLTLSMDNYFVSREETPLDENGEHDYESLYSIDLDLFNQQVQDLLDGKEVSLPTYSFAKGVKEYFGDKMKMRETDMLIIEGIHALNPELLKTIPEEKKFKIYASALTTISLDDHNWIPTTDNRLIRRIVRDAKYRAYPAQKTIARWPSVRRGEDKWIFPFQENADAMFNSALLYELTVLKRHAEPILQSVPRNCPEYAEATRLLRFLSYFSPILDEEMPPTSLLREFFGGSSFKY